MSRPLFIPRGRREKPEQDLSGRFVAVDPAVRFHRHYRKDASGCWLWEAKKHKAGYGLFFPTRTKSVTAHRFSWHLHRGDIPPNLHICHRCDVPACVNPDHLFLGTDQDNHTDKTLKGRAAVKLTADQAAAIRIDRRHPVKIAEAFGVSRCTVDDIKARRTWRHL